MRSRLSCSTVPSAELPPLVPGSSPGALFPAPKQAEQTPAGAMDRSAVGDLATGLRPGERPEAAEAPDPADEATRMEARERVGDDALDDGEAPPPCVDRRMGLD